MHSMLRKCGDFFFMITFARATVLPRYSEIMFIFFVSVPLQIEQFAKVRTISISFQYNSK